jgi:acetyltransferase-like isoleucine patch superfamily enzyme
MIGDAVTLASRAAPRSGKRAVLGKRNYEETVTGGPNAHRHWYRVRDGINGPLLGPVLIVCYYAVVHAAKHLPSLALKRWVYRCLGMRLGRNVTVASGATLDYFFPELIEIHDNTIIGMNAMILTHEFLLDRWRRGRVIIGSGVMLGAASTVLAGVEIGDNATISAMSLVNRSIPPNTFVAGVPIQPR